MENLTLCSSISHSADFWKRKTRQIDNLAVGDYVMLGGQGSFKVLGVRDGRIEFMHPQHGPSTIDPMLITGVVVKP